MSGPVADERAQPGHPVFAIYEGPTSERIELPLGGIGAGMVCLEGRGGLTSWSLDGIPRINRRPFCAVALASPDGTFPARLLEGPVPNWKRTFPFGTDVHGGANGAPGSTFGWPRMEQVRFHAGFPAATVELMDAAVPFDVWLTGWSPFTPPVTDDSSLPVAVLEYRVRRRAGDTGALRGDVSRSTSSAARGAPVDDAPSRGGLPAVLSFHLRNPLVETAERGSVGRGSQRLVFSGAPDDTDGGLAHRELVVACDAGETRVDAAWFRGDWWDDLTLVWRAVDRGEILDRPPHDDAAGPAAGGSLYVPIELEPGEERTIRFLLAWYSREPLPCAGQGSCDDRSGRRSWYRSHFSDAGAVADSVLSRIDELRDRTMDFQRVLLENDLPPAVQEAVAANLAILRSPTVLRDGAGRLLAWEGCFDDAGCCHGTCTHVWNYAQAIASLFGDLERGQRDVEHRINLDHRGHQNFRGSFPIGSPDHNNPPAADGQLGAIVRVWREWRLSGDREWLERVWPGVRLSLDYAIATWDPMRRGVVEAPHHTTYDIEFHGAEPMATGVYAAALIAAAHMAVLLGDDDTGYRDLAARARRTIEHELYNGEYLRQLPEFHRLSEHRPDPLLVSRHRASPEAEALVASHGPKYQYGEGCLADAVIGAFLADQAGLPLPFSRAVLASHLSALVRHNFRPDLSAHANPQRATFALGDEGGLLLCTWPYGGEPELPFVYSNEVWSGVEYAVAALCARVGMRTEALRIITATRTRYDGGRRNPYDEYECGHYYARALSSFGLTSAWSGVSVDLPGDAVTIRSDGPEGRFPVFCSTGFGLVERSAEQIAVRAIVGTLPSRIHIIEEQQDGS